MQPENRLHRGLGNLDRLLRPSSARGARGHKIRIFRNPIGSIGREVLRIRRILADLLRRRAHLGELLFCTRRWRQRGRPSRNGALGHPHGDVAKVALGVVVRVQVQGAVDRVHSHHEIQLPIHRFHGLEEHLHVVLLIRQGAALEHRVLPQRVLETLQDLLLERLGFGDKNLQPHAGGLAHVDKPLPRLHALTAQMLRLGDLLVHRREDVLPLDLLTGQQPVHHVASRGRRRLGDKT
mmetsp:Transcript_19426/g.73399  ORF Transcript_19426/g.73399 Transcript_19426/m.73399 type:complete len:237 (-) Transcript_19426:724-1434(-)|eukprot:scaffold4097_cov306-Pinguiococcus_pyrenoidosus.AAC.6